VITHDIMRATAAHYRITLDDLTRPSRRWHAARPRMVAMWIAYRRYQKGYSVIGHRFHRHPATVRSAVSHIDDAILEDDVELKWSIEQISERLRCMAAA
jgi:chromosomal replication initiation ATPase DnaA